MFLKTVFLSILLIFLLQLIYNFVYDRFLTNAPPKETKFTEVEKYKKIAEEVAAAAAAASQKAAAPPAARPVIETIFEAAPPTTIQDDMENCLLDLVING